MKPRWLASNLADNHVALSLSRANFWIFVASSFFKLDKYHFFISLLFFQ